MRHPLDKVYLGTNTKMFMTAAEAKTYIDRLLVLTKDIRDEINLFVIPSFTSLATVKGATDGTGIMVGAQNMGWEERGQYTGEISPLMLKELCVDLVMAGHSERRHVFRETDKDEEKKVVCAAQHGLKVLLCVGETARQKEYGVSKETLRTQLMVGLHSLSKEYAEQFLWIAYEPVWAIGVNGLPASEAYAEEMHQCIKSALCELYGERTGLMVPVLYGGSVNNDNAEAFMKQPHIDGLFIGRSAWDADNFNHIIRSIMPVFKRHKGLRI